MISGRSVLENLLFASLDRICITCRGGGDDKWGVPLLLSIPREEKVQERMEVRKLATDPNWLSPPFSLCLSPGFLL